MKISNDVRYIGVNDHEVDLFEGQYHVPNGMSYNSYVILDEQIAVMDDLGLLRGNSFDGTLYFGAAVMLALTIRLYQRYHTLDLDEIYMIARSGEKKEGTK